jgi:ubiquinone/menaquinone biosynthesis C-methylase UbiE
MEIILKITLLLFVLLAILFLFFRVLIKKLLLNHKLLAIPAKKFYNYFYSIKGNHLWVNNYGYAPIDDEIARYAPDHQYGLQLYKELVKNHHGYVINENCSVVEVGCGKGAGAEFLVKKFKPKKYTAIDYSKKAIEFCNTAYQQIQNVQFICADAHQLPFSTNSVDVIINVESSHIYEDPTQFFNEVHRILKKDGKFLFTDYRFVKTSPIEKLEKEMCDCGFVITEKRVITPQIYKACILASELRQKIIDEGSPWYLKKYFAHYAALNGTTKSKQFNNGEIIYFIYHLEKKALKKKYRGAPNLVYPIVILLSQI